jgi:hypothetical protein
LALGHSKWNIEKDLQETCPDLIAIISHKVPGGTEKPGQGKR